MNIGWVSCLARASWFIFYFVNLPGRVSAVKCNNVVRSGFGSVWVCCLALYVLCFIWALTMCVLHRLFVLSLSWSSWMGFICGADCMPLGISSTHGREGEYCSLVGNKGNIVLWSGEWCHGKHWSGPAALTGLCHEVDFVGQLPEFDDILILIDCSHLGQFSLNTDLKKNN